MEGKNQFREVNVFEVIFVGMLFTFYIYSFHLVPVLSPLLISLSPVLGAILAAYFYRKGRGVLAFVIVPLFFGLSAELPLGLYLIFGLPPLLIATQMRKNHRLEQIISINTFVIIAGFVTFSYWLINVLGFDFQALLDNVTKEYITIIEESNMLDKETLGVFKLNIQQYMDTIKQLWMAVIVIASIILAVLQSYLARIFATLFKWKIYDLKRVFYYSIPRGTILFLMVCLIVAELSKSEIVNFVFFTLIVVITFIITLNGISYSIYHIMKTKEIGLKVLLGVATPLVVLFIPTIMTIIGGMDAALHKRKAA